MSPSLVRTGCIIAMAFEDNVAHTAGVEKRGVSCGPDVLVAVHREDNMLTASNPSVDFALEVVEDGCSRFSVLVLGLEVRPLLSPCCEEGGRGLLTWPIGGDNTQTSIPLSAILGPYPLPETCWVAS
jgi:hypothetical protein